MKLSPSELENKGPGMFDEKKVKDLVLTSLVADAYSLGAHWIYDEQQLSDLYPSHFKMQELVPENYH